MNAFNLAQTAYASTHAPVRTERGKEYDTFARITRKLKSTNRDTNYPDFVRALHENRQLWNLLAIDVSSEENQLPGNLRAQIFYLSEFTSNYTSRIFAEGIGIDVLVDINTAIMTGLRTSRESA